MEGQMRTRLFDALFLLVGAFAVTLWVAAPAIAQESVSGPESGQAEISLRKSVNTKKIQGQIIEGEDRVIGKGDSLWRILVEEKGLPGQKFQSHIVMIRGLNPQLKNLDVLRIGDKIFIPLRPDQALDAWKKPELAAGASSAPGAGVTTDYRIKAGEHLYQILRSQLKLADERKIAQYYALVKDLNPERKNWDTLAGGEVIRLPTVGPMREVIAAAPAAARGAKTAPDVSTASESGAVILPTPSTENKPAIAPMHRQGALRAPAKENMALFAKITEAIGGQLQQSGEEIVVFKDESLRFDRSIYPVVFSPALRQRVVLDPGNAIPVSLKNKLNDPTIRMPVLRMSKEVSIQEAVSQLLAALGYQTLPADRPVEIQDQGIAYEARGDWMALGPEERNKTQEVFVINLSDNPNAVPEYLKAQLVKNGLSWRVVELSADEGKPAQATKSEAADGLTAIKTWPRGKEEIIDSLLLSYGVPFGVAEGFSVELRDGLRVDMRTDRLIEMGGKRIALFFRPGDRDLRKALEEGENLRAVEVNIAALSSREIISKILGLLGDSTPYRENHFSAVNGTDEQKLTVKAWGFQLVKRSLFITDRQIPAALNRFFFEKGLEIIYFQ